MNTIFSVLLLILLGICLPYLLKTYHLKTISENDLPELGQWVKLSEGNIYYRWFEPKLTSKEEIVVLVHGFSTPSFVWKGLLNRLTESGFKVLVYDHYGRGFSERPKTRYSKDLYVESLKELLDSQSVSSPVHLVGYSMGGPIVGHFADKYSELTKSITLLAPAGFGLTTSGITSWQTMPVLGEWFWHVFNHKIYGVGKMSETAGSDDPLSISEEEFLANFNEQLRFKGFTESLLNTVRDFNLFNTQDMYKSLGSKSIPTLALWGTDDGVVPFSGSKELLKCIPHANLDVIEEGTHDITYRQPTHVVNSLIKFLDSIE
jgi:pimeloyl-ACP methyl ester carboxylesterase